MKTDDERDGSRGERSAKVGRWAGPRLVLTRRLGCAVAAAAILAWPAAAHGGAGSDEPVGLRPAWQEASAVPAGFTERALESRNGRPPLLAVPYVAQEELLCGGAAAAMVLRYWGARQEAAAYAHLVDPESRGIPTVDLVDALRRDRWRALPFSGSAESVRDHLDAGRPVITLMEVRPGWYHYVVVVAWINEQVVLHDPAIGPYQVLPEADFERAWAAARNWSLLVLPEGARPSSEGRLDPTDIPTSAVGDGELPSVGPRPVTLANDDAADACGPLVESGIDAARAGDTAAAEARFRVAMAACPRSPAPPRELAGLRFRQERWADAVQLARQALSLDPADRYTRRLLASARFLAGDRDGALEDWNGLEEPRVDLVEVRGLTRTRHPVVGRMLSLRAGDLLTRERLVQSRRRLSELPTARLTRLRYEPPRDGRSTVVAAVVERPLLQASPFAIGAAVARAAVSGEAALTLAGPTGGGDVWTPWWRWGDGRSGAGLGVALPAPAGIGAVWSIDVHRHEEAFAGGTAAPGFPATEAAAGISSVTPSPPPAAEPSSVMPSPPPAASLRSVVVERTHAGLTIADWSRSDTRWEVSSGWDRWHGRGQHLFFGAAVERRLAADRLALRLDSTAWTSVGARRGAFMKGGVSATWRSAAEEVASPTAWHGTVGVRVVGGEAPFDLWPGAGLGELREPLLRAHPLAEDGSIRPGGVGRSLFHGTLEHRRRLAQLGPVGLSAAVFTDVARIGSPVPLGNRDHGSVLEIDAGAGLRLRLPGQPGLLRLDLAKGLLDGATSFSAGWILDGPR